MNILIIDIRYKMNKRIKKKRRKKIRKAMEKLLDKQDITVKMYEVFCPLDYI